MDKRATQIKLIIEAVQKFTPLIDDKLMAAIDELQKEIEVSVCQKN